MRFRDEYLGIEFEVLTPQRNLRTAPFHTRFNFQDSDYQPYAILDARRLGDLDDNATDADVEYWAREHVGAGASEWFVFFTETWDGLHTNIEEVDPHEATGFLYVREDNYLHPEDVHRLIEDMDHWEKRELYDFDGRIIYGRDIDHALERTFSKWRREDLVCLD